MTKEELISFINTYVRNSAIDAFTNDRLNTILLGLAIGGVTDHFDTYAEFKTAIATGRTAGQDWYIKALIVNDERTGGKNFIYEYFPAPVNAINWTASQTIDSNP